MKRLECTKCRKLQDQCNCDTQTVDLVDLLESRPLLGNDTPDHLNRAIKEAQSRHR